MLALPMAEELTIHDGALSKVDMLATRVDTSGAQRVHHGQCTPVPQPMVLASLNAIPTPAAKATSIPTTNAIGTTQAFMEDTHYEVCTDDWPGEWADE